MSNNLKSIITCDLDGKIETFSDGAQDLFGYSSEEVIGKIRVSDFSEGQVVLGHVVNWLKESVEKGEWVGNTVFLAKDKTEIPCEIKITPTKDKDGNKPSITGQSAPQRENGMACENEHTCWQGTRRQHHQRSRDP